MINFDNGCIELDTEFDLIPNSEFEKFKKSKYYSNQNEKYIVEIEGLHRICGKEFFVSLVFQNSKLKQVCLMMSSSQILDFADELNRKIIHDKFLAEIRMSDNNNFEWGNIVSEFDRKSCISSIIFSYN